MNISWVDWMIVLVPVVFVWGMGWYSRRYARGVSDFLSAGRLCGRYVISVGDIANGLSIIGLMSFIEIHYKTGFALEFWKQLTLPLSIFIGLTGFFTYRFRETKAMSLGQFLEMRYSRKFRIFASGLRSLSEIIANSIMPAVAARFFIYFLDLPRSINVFGLEISTFVLIMVICLFLAVSILCMGGTLALVVTDSIQGMFMYPILAIFVAFILWKFSWTGEIVPVMMDRAAGESFLDPYDLEKLRDFNVFFLIVTIYNTIAHRGSWIGAGYSTA
ncbi:MAG: sodium:panthothenate symporter, partial [Lentisphaerae bacterium]|nr:sodium:panthothenate symporter [Lentisphaerota bacterium]